MMLNRLIFTFALILATSTSAFAEQQREYKGGMHYTTLKPPAVTTKGNAIENPEEVKEDTPESRVWKKYKALASGETEEQKAKEAENALPQAPTHPVKPQTANAAQEEDKPNPTGMAAIIQEYQKSKSQRSQMRSIKIATPEKPSVEKPNIEKSETEKN